MIDRGFTGHEHLYSVGLINMNGRVYDPHLGKFLSPDPYVQDPLNPLNYNRYAYCLNNPLKYTDPSGELAANIVGAIVGGVVGGVLNLATNWDNCDGTWEYVAAFGAGAVGGAASGFLLGSDGGASFAAVVGVGAASGALTAGTNDVIAQTGTNFEGHVDWNHTGQMMVSGAASGAVSSMVGYGISTSNLVNGSIQSPIVRSLVASPITSAAGHIAGGTAYGLANRQDFYTAYSNSFDGIWSSVAWGTAIGVGSTYISCKYNKIDPWTGKKISTKAYNHDYKYHKRIRAEALKDPAGHNYPYTYDDIILQVDPIIQSDGSHLYRYPGSLNSQNGYYEIGVNPNTKVIFHRSFRSSK